MSPLSKSKHKYRNNFLGYIYYRVSLDLCILQFIINLCIPLGLIVGRFAGLFTMLLNGQHTVESPAQVYDSCMYFPTSRGMGGFKFEINAFICGHRFVGTQNDGRPVGMWQGVRRSVSSLSSGTVNSERDILKLLNHKYITITKCLL